MSKRAPSDSHRRLAEKREEWIACLSGEDRNSICNQLYQTVWNTAVFRVINKARSFAPRAAGGELEINGLLHRLLDRCFWESQLLALRRLSDKEELSGKRGVYSLVSVIADMQKHTKLLRRADMFKEEGLEYDVSLIKEKREAFISTMTTAAFFVPREYCYQDSEDRHHQIDKLAAVSAGERSPDDTVTGKVFDGLMGKVKEACETTEVYVNKFLAHPATDASRAGTDADEFNIQLGDLWKAHEKLCKTANFLCGHILNKDYHMTFLPMAFSDVLIHVDKPLVATENVDYLRACWKTCEEEAQVWGHWTVTDLLGR